MCELGDVISITAKSRGDLGFKSGPLNRLSWLEESVVRGFPQSPTKMLEKYLKSGHKRFLPYPFQFNINLAPYSTLYKAILQVI